MKFTILGIFTTIAPKTPKKPCARGYFSTWGENMWNLAEFHEISVFSWNLEKFCYFLDFLRKTGNSILGALPGKEKVENHENSAFHDFYENDMKFYFLQKSQKIMKIYKNYSFA